MKKLVLLLAVFAGVLLCASCTNQNEEESEILETYYNIDGDDNQEPDPGPPN